MNPCLLHIASGPLIMGGSLGVATTVATLLIGQEGFLQSLVQALLCSGLAVVLLLLTRNRPSESFAAAPYQWRAMRFLAGAGVALAAAVGSLLAFKGLGLLTSALVSPGVLLNYLATTFVLAFFLEALPEELTMRGRTFTALNQTQGVVVTALVTTALFTLVPLVANTTSALIDLLLTGRWVAPSFVPVGEDPVAYLVLLVIFGLTLATLRALSGSIWPGVGLHITFLLFNRAVLFGKAERSGIATHLLSPDSLLLVPLYLLLAAGGYWALARVRGRVSGE